MQAIGAITTHKFGLSLVALNACLAKMSCPMIGSYFLRFCGRCCRSTFCAASCLMLLIRFTPSRVSLAASYGRRKNGWCCSGLKPSACPTHSLGPGRLRNMNSIECAALGALIVSFGANPLYFNLLVPSTCV
ncbi:hypothetical protein GQ53DRAFT_148283 [Thozetella sp. PMI_491]|nr:hypothetical protein GQ53DRAFT_148283 [Thozetella sp. PMI_491]